MIEMSLAEVAVAVGGRLTDAQPQAKVTGAVEYDSRLVGPGGLFLAFAGKQADGHDFAAAALHAGAVAVLGTRHLPGTPMVLVDDPLSAIGALARAVVARLDRLTIVGITGSSGKTTTKDLIGQLLADLGPTVAPAGSFNTELGLPHTVLRVDHDTRFLVLEMGARGLGHIEYLTHIARPDLGVVLNVGTAHLGEFGSVAAIAAAKAELVEALAPEGIAVLNLDDPAVAAMAGQTKARVLGYGLTAAAAIRAEGVRLDARGRPRYRLCTPAGTAEVALGVAGAHQVSNTLAAAAVATELGMDLRRLAAALGDLRIVSARRMDVFDRPDGVTVIDDSYNANPDSTAAALRALAALAGQRRQVAVLGYLAELGAHERGGHEEVGRLAASQGVHRLIVVGDNAAAIQDGALTVKNWKGTSVRVPDQEQAVALVRAELRPGDVVLVKGSRYRTWAVADALRPPTGPPDTDVDTGVRAWQRREAEAHG